LKRILIVGRIGDSDVETEGLLRAVIGDLRRYREPLEIILPAEGSDPRRLESDYGVISFPHDDMDRLLTALETADLVLVVGLLDDADASRPDTFWTPRHRGLVYTAGIAWLAAQLGVPVMLYGIRVASDLTEAGVQLLQEAATAAACITVSDPVSAEQVRRMGVSPTKFEITADPLWGFRPKDWFEMTPEVTGAAAGVSWVGVVFPDVPTPSGEVLTQALVDWATRAGMGILWLPRRPDAVPTSRATVPVPLVVRDVRRLTDALALVRRCDLVLGSGPAAFVLACWAGTPVVLLDDDPRVQAWASTLRPSPPVLSPVAWTPTELQEALDTARSAGPMQVRAQRSLAERLRSAAGRNVQRAWELLDRGPDRLPEGALQRIRAELQRRWKHSAQDLPEEKSIAWLSDLMSARPDAASVLARRVPGLVRIVAPQFFDTSGQRVIFGGAERYLIELAAILRDLGADVEVVQMASQTGWERSAFGLRVIGVPAPNFLEVEPALYRAGAARPAVTIHLAFWTAGRATLPPSIGISHGVFWDHPYYQMPEHLAYHRERLLESIECLDVLVSVDANTINALRATSTRLAEKCVRIPNFVDTRKYAPAPRDGDDIVVLYPRRLVAERGFWLMAEIIPALLRDHPRLVVELVGDHAGEAERQEAERLVARFPGRVRWRTVPFDEMPEVYRAADIVVIPTVYAEGTSLACLEAMACGKAVVATRVGGLPELIIDGYNGLLVEPTAADVRAGIERLLLDSTLRARLGRRAVSTARAFDIARWRARWRDLLRTFWLPAGSG
jgi:glycosyltransferase involved in cell wall biosynthesis